MILFDCLLVGFTQWKTLLFASLFFSGLLATVVFLWLEQRLAATLCQDTLRFLHAQLAKGTIDIKEYNQLKTVL